MDYQEAINKLQHEKGLKIIGNARKIEDFFEALDVAISAMQELQMYKDSKPVLIPDAVHKKQCEELDKYKQMGTLEEVRKAVEKQKAKKPILDEPLMILECPSCGSYIQKVVDDEGSTEGFIPMYCKDCGQYIDADWSEKNE